MKSFGAMMVRWGGSGLVLGAAAGLLQSGMTAAAPAKKRAVPGEISTVARPGLERPVAAESGRVSETRGRELRLLEKLVRASRTDLEVLTKEMLESEADYYGLLSLWDRWIEVDAERGFELLTSGAFPEKPPHQPFIWSYLGRWSLRDPEAAVGKMLTLDQRDMDVAGSRISHELCVKRPADFFRLLPQLRRGHDANYCLASAAYHLAAQDPAAAVKWLEEWPANGQKSRNGNSAAEHSSLVAALAMGWAGTDARAALAWARGLPDSKDRTAGMQNIAQRMARDEPEQAAAVLTELYGSPSQNGAGENGALIDALKKVSQDWVAEDPGAAMRWLTERFGKEGEFVVKGMVAEQIPRESGAAVDYLVRHFALLEQRGGVWNLSDNRWAPDEARAGLARAAEIPDPAQRQSVEGYFLKALAHNDPRAAIEGAQKHLTDPGARGVILGTAMTAWAKEDITAASGWLQSQSAGAERDAAIKGLLPVAAQTEPDSALQWAAALSTTEQRTAQVVTTLQRMNRRGNEEVKEALAGVPLTEAEISNVLLLLNRTSRPNQ